MDGFRWNCILAAVLLRKDSYENLPRKGFISGQHAWIKIGPHRRRSIERCCKLCANTTLVIVDDTIGNDNARQRGYVPRIPRHSRPTFGGAGGGRPACHSAIVDALTTPAPLLWPRRRHATRAGTARGLALFGPSALAGCGAGAAAHSQCQCEREGARAGFRHRRRRRLCPRQRGTGQRGTGVPSR